MYTDKNIETWFDSMNLTSTEREFWQQRANITKDPISMVIIKVGIISMIL